MMNGLAWGLIPISKSLLDFDLFSEQSDHRFDAQSFHCLVRLRSRVLIAATVPR